MAELKDFEELSSCRADYKKVAVATEKDYLLHFCATLWVENADHPVCGQRLWQLLNTGNAFQNTSNQEKVIQSQIKVTQLS